jgi:hypothetical protein
MTMSIEALVWACLLAACPTGGDTYFINQQQIRIPISIDPARRPEIKEIHLFVSADEGKTWDHQAVASTNQDAFSFSAPKDGMYWFSVVVVNQQNQREPADIYTTPPSQKLVIDTLKPVLHIRSAERQGEDAVVAWEIQEDYPDWKTLRMEYRQGGVNTSQWIPVSVTTAPLGQARFRPTVAGAVALRMHLQDIAGNHASAETELPAAANMQLTAAPPAPVTAPPVPTLPAAPSRTEPQSPAEPAPFTPGVPTSTGNATSVDPSRLVATSDPQAGVTASQPNPAATRPMRGSLPNLVITNNRQLTLDYEVTKVGPSGIGRVELWVTRDDGKSWEKLGENPELKPPMTVDLASEGQYGFRLVLHSRAGRAQATPTPGVIPELRLELDTTSPIAQLYRPEPDPKQADALILSWNATDRNLTSNPITLQWCEKPGQEWQTIVTDHPNDGRYTWRLPPSVPYLVYLRLMVHDTAGNSSVAETPEPVCIDLKEPEGRLIGIAGGGIRTPAGRDSARRPAEARDVALPVSFEKNR